MFPSHPLFRRFENEIVVGEQKMEWATWGDDFFFRPRGANIEIIWCCLRRSDYAKKLLDPCQFLKASRKVVKEMTLSHAWRFWPHSESCDLLFRSRYGLVHLQEVEELVRFDVEKHFFDPKRLLTSPEQMHETIASCERKIEEIRGVMGRPRQEKGWQSVQWPWGTHDELRNLLQAMGQIVRRPEHDSFEWRYEVRPNFSARISLKTPYMHSKIPDAALYEPFLGLLRTHFPVRSDKLVLYNMWGNEWKYLWPIVVISSEIPTQHERLEALLVWRDFLCDKMPPEEIGALLLQ